MPTSYISITHDWNWSDQTAVEYTRPDGVPQLSLTTLPETYAGTFAQTYAGKMSKLMSGLASGSFNGAVFHAVTSGTACDTASGTITITHANVTNGDTVTIAGVAFEAVSADPTGNQWLIGGNANADRDNLIAAINACAEFGGMLFATTGDGTGVVQVTFLLAGPIGRLISLATSDATAFALSGATLESTDDLTAVSSSFVAAFGRQPDDENPNEGPVPPVQAPTNAGKYCQPETWNNADQNEVDWVAGHDYVVASRGPTAIANLKVSNPSVLCLRYRKLQGVDEVQDPTLFADAEAAGIIPWLDGDTNPVVNVVNGWSYCDIVDPTKRADWIDLIIAWLDTPLNSEGYDGVMFDDVDVLEPLLSGTASAIPANYDQATYYDAMAEIIDAAKAAYPTKYILFNSYRGISAPTYSGVSILTDHDADAIYFEAFAFQTSGNYYSVDRYQQQMDDFITCCTAKSAFALDYGSATDYSRRLFSFASYLLTQNQETSQWRFGGTSNANADGLQDYPEYHIEDMGVPSGDYTREGNDLFTREYANGIVITNPTSGSLSYTLPFESMELLSVSGGGDIPVPDGTATWTPQGSTTVSIGAHTGAIFRKAI